MICVVNYAALSTLCSFSNHRSLQHCLSRQKSRNLKVIKIFCHHFFFLLLFCYTYKSKRTWNPFYFYIFKIVWIPARFFMLFSFFFLLSHPYFLTLKNNEKINAKRKNQLQDARCNFFPVFIFICAVVVHTAR